MSLPRHCQTLSVLYYCIQQFFGLNPTCTSVCICQAAKEINAFFQFMSIHHCSALPWAFGSSLSPICQTSHSGGSFVAERAGDLRGAQCPWPGRPAGVLPTGQLIGLEHRLPSFPMWATAVLLHNVKQHDSHPLSESFHCSSSTEEAEPHTKAKSDTGSLVSQRNACFLLHLWFVIEFCCSFIDRILFLSIQKVTWNKIQQQHE